MTDEKWPLTDQAIAASERAAGPTADDLTNEDDPELGMSLLRALAAEGRMQEYEPGRFYVSKLDD